MCAASKYQAGQGLAFNLCSAAIHGAICRSFGPAPCFNSLTRAFARRPAPLRLDESIKVAHSGLDNLGRHIEGSAHLAQQRMHLALVLSVLCVGESGAPFLRRLNDNACLVLLPNSLHFSPVARWAPCTSVQHQLIPLLFSGLPVCIHSAVQASKEGARSRHVATASWTVTH